jgi:hypothetical protein
MKIIQFQAVPKVGDSGEQVLTCIGLGEDSNLYIWNKDGWKLAE